VLEESGLPRREAENRSDNVGSAAASPAPLLTSSKQKFRHSLESQSRQGEGAQGSLRAAERVEDIRKTVIRKKIEVGCNPRFGQPG